jgi:quinoprotein glucose dehydrogenase
MATRNRKLTDRLTRGSRLAAGLLIFAGLTIPACKSKFGVTAPPVPNTDWPTYGGNKAENRYSPLQEINISNVKDLQIAWTYDAREQQDSGSRPREIQCQPIVVHGILYGLTAALSCFAVNAATGEQLWKFQPVRDDQRFNNNRGLVYWEDGDDKRILYTSGGTLYALNALSGKPVLTFGDSGRVDLHTGLGEGLNHDVSKLSVTSTTPGVIYKNTLIIGSSVSEGGDAAPGHVRGFDVLTGRLKWIFHTIPLPGDPGYETWPKDAYNKIGADNSWGGMALDEKRGTVYFGTGSPSSDFYGGARTGIDLFGNCIVALDAGTGKLKWYFQTVHHDLWDRDIACPPNLVTVRHGGKMVDAVAQATKDGLIYVLDRDSGTSLFPIEERSVPTSGLPGEHPWPVQHFPTKPLPLCHQVFTDSDLTNISAEAHAYVQERYRHAKQPPNKFNPPGVEGTFLFGYSGGAEWGGNATDPQGILYQNSNDDPWDLQMIDAATMKRQSADLPTGNIVYLKNCGFCHGMDRKGTGHEFPSLVGISQKRSAADIGKLIATGAGKMPSFPYMKEDDKKALIDFLLNREAKTTSGNTIGEHGAGPSGAMTPQQTVFPYLPAYVIKTWRRFTDKDGYDATKPPWGTMNAIDLNTGDYLWRVPLGEYPELTKKGIPITGSESYGGPLATAGGLVFIAGTPDERIRAFDKMTGKIVWEYQLPAGGFATPITYEMNGKQFIVLAVGGSRYGSKPGGWYMAFALK